MRKLHTMINGNKLMKLRLATGKTKYKVAQDLGVMPATIGTIENGKNKNPGICLVKDLADYYGVPIDALVFADDFQQR